MRIRRNFTLAVPVSLLMVLQLLLPSLAGAQQAPGKKAGMVTGLKGEATIAHLPRPTEQLPVKFRDDIFFQDTIRTQRNSLVRVLMDGRALVTIRELSDVQIKEEPGRSQVTMGVGRMALQLLKRLMGNDVIEIATPNAVAAVRGSFVTFNSSEVGNEPQVNVFNLFSHDPVPVCDQGKATSCVTLRSKQTVTATGRPGSVRYSRVTDLFDDQVAALADEFTSERPFEHNFTVAPDLAASMGEAGIQQATALANLISGGPDGAEGFVGPGFPLIPPTQRDPTTNIILGSNVPKQGGNGGAPGGAPGGGGPPVAGCPCPLANGGFETGDFTGWMAFAQPGSSGAINVQTGRLSPISANDVPAPPEGRFAAMTDQNGPGSYSLSQVVTVPPGSSTLRFSLFIGNRDIAHATPNSLDFNVTPNQQARVDILTPAAGPQDVGAGVLRNLFMTREGDPLVSGYNSLAFDLSDFAGQDVQIRFSEADNQFFFQMGVDDVLFEAAPVGPEGVETALVYVDWSNLRLSDPLLSGNGETRSSTSMLVEIDDSLIDATAPLINLVRGSKFTAGDDGLRIVGRSNVTARGSELIRLDASQINILKGSLAKLDRQSRLTVAGDFLHMANGSVLNILNGSLFSVAGESSATIAGALVRFSGTGGNVINVSNNLVPTGFFNGIPVFVSGGGNVTVTNPTPIVGLNSLGTIKINGTALPNGATAASGITGSLIEVRGGGTVKIGP